MIALLVAPVLLHAQAQPTRDRSKDLMTALAFVDPTKDFVKAGDKCYCLLRPKVIADGNIGDMWWSSDGKALLYVGQTYEPMFDSALRILNPGQVPAETLYEWYPATGTSDQVLTIDGAQRLIDDFQWFSDSLSFLVEIREREGGGAENYSIYRFSPSNQSGTLVVRSQAPIAIDPSPQRPLALLTDNSMTPQRTLAYTLIDSEGGSVPIEPFDPKLGMLLFDVNGGLQMMSSMLDPTSKRRISIFHPVDERTGKILIDQESKGVNLSSPQPPVLTTLGMTESSLSDSTGKGSTGMRSLWLIPSDRSVENKATTGASVKKQPDFPRAFVAADATNAQVAPNGMGVCYLSKGVLLYRPLITVDLETMAAVAKIERRLVAISNAKLVALAMLMYANDWDDHLPSVGSWSTDINPYLKDPTIQAGFVYAYQGDLNMNNIQQPATTILGYFATDEGRAVAYTDGHVVWQPNP